MRNSSKKKVIWSVSLVAGFALLSTAALVGIAVLQGLGIKDDLSVIAADSKQFLAVAKTGDEKAMTSLLSKESATITQAITTTEGFPWQFASSLPFVGENFRSINVTLKAAEILVTDVAKPAVPVISKSLSAGGLIVNGGINTALLNEAWTLLGDTSPSIDRAKKLVSGIHSEQLVPQIRGGIDKVSSAIVQLSSIAEIAQNYENPLNSLLGVTGERNYLLVFQNPAEMRPLGGLPGAIALLNVTNGSINLVTHTSASKSIYTPLTGDEYAPADSTKEMLFHENANRIMAQAMNTASYSEAASRVKGHWERTFGDYISGVISIDPVALGYLMNAIGPITLDSGGVLDQNNMAPYLLNEVYKTVDDNAAQDELFAEVVDKFVAKLKAGPINPLLFFENIQKSTEESRILFWSPDPTEQQLSVDMGTSVEPPSESENTVKTGVYFMFAQGSKMYYYLNQEVSETSEFCAKENTQYVTVDYSLTNILTDEESQKLAPSIWAVSDVKPIGAILSRVFVYAPPGATITSVVPNNPEDVIKTVMDGANPVSVVESLVAPGGNEKVRVTYSLPTTQAKKAQLYTTPLSHPTKKTILTTNCSH